MPSLITQQTRVLTELDFQRRDLMERDAELMENAVRKLVLLGLSYKQARDAVDAEGRLRIVPPDS